jgi:hypothetical protein
MVFASTHHPWSVAQARRVGEGATVLAGALGLIEGREVIGEASNGLLEERVPFSAVARGAKAVEADFPC